ncbi:MarR family transcriptional regulator [Neptuniibacter halophilus]|uniref:MarR family transcriptional regulator n=1 Tax=Neptuniibacter halophilus TaxID=651666 RepID=UPI0025737B92|nr:helix-turn-helix domain-containing protein [Neptuniibacter halophilus]
MSFPKGDLRRTWMVLGAIDKLEHPSARKISQELGLPVSTVQAQLSKLSGDEIPGLRISLANGTYTIEDWGSIIKAAGIRAFYKQNLTGSV